MPRYIVVVHERHCGGADDYAYLDDHCEHCGSQEEVCVCERNNNA